jgi:hypothetical protein
MWNKSKSNLRVLCVLSDLLVLLFFAKINKNRFVLKNVTKRAQHNSDANNKLLKIYIVKLYVEKKKNYWESWLIEFWLSCSKTTIELGFWSS